MTALHHAQHRARRARKTRYRQPRFLNRAKSKGWLAPSLLSRVHNCETWTFRLSKLAPITDIAVETARFDMQIMDNPNISGTEYQQGTLMGFELREYLLQRDKHTCQYCGGASNDNILNLDHKHPRAKGGSNRAIQRTRAKQQSRIHGFTTGDIIIANVPSGKKKGIYTGRVAVRANGYFNITTNNTTVQGIKHKHCQTIHCRDGYHYY